MGRFKLAAVLLAVTANPTTAIKSLFGRDLDPVTAFEGSTPLCATSFRRMSLDRSRPADALETLRTTKPTTHRRHHHRHRHRHRRRHRHHRVHGGSVLGL